MKLGDAAKIYRCREANCVYDSGLAQQRAQGEVDEDEEVDEDFEEEVEEDNDEDGDEEAEEEEEVCLVLLNSYC